MFNFHRLLAPKAPLRQIWMAATMRAKIHCPKLNLTQNSDEILNPSVPLAFRLSGILMDATAHLRVETNEVWKVKSASADPTRVPKGAKYASVTLSPNHNEDLGEIKKSLPYSHTATIMDFQLTSYFVMKLHSMNDSFLSQNLQGDQEKDHHQVEVDNIALNDSYQADTTTLTHFESMESGDGAVGSHLYLLLIMDSTPLQIIISAEVEVNEAWKVKSAPSDPTRLPSGKTQAKKGDVALIWPEENLPSFMKSLVKSPVVGSCFGMVCLQAHIPQYRAYQFVVVRHLSSRAKPRTVRIMIDGSYLWEREEESEGEEREPEGESEGEEREPEGESEREEESKGEEREPEGAGVGGWIKDPEGAGVGGWIKDLTSNTFLEAFQKTCTENYKHPSTALLEYAAAERGYRRVLTYPYKFDRVIFVSDSETFLREFEQCLKDQRYPKLPRRGDPTYKEKLACYHSLKRLLKKIPPGTAIKLEKIPRAENTLPDLLAKMGRKTKKNKVYRSVQQIKQEYEKATAKGYKLPEIKDHAWGNLTRIPPTSGYGFIVWNPKG